LLGMIKEIGKVQEKCNLHVLHTISGAVVLDFR